MLQDSPSTLGEDLLNHLIRPLQKRRRDRQAEGLGGLEVDHYSRQFDVFILGDQDTCEVVRQRDATQSIAVTPACVGPRYFERVTQESTK